MSLHFIVGFLQVCKKKKNTKEKQKNLSELKFLKVGILSSTIYFKFGM